MLGIQAPWSPLSLLSFDMNGEDLFLGSRQGSHMLACSSEVVGMCIVDVLLEVKKKQSASRAGGGPPPLAGVVEMVCPVPGGFVIGSGLVCHRTTSWQLFDNGAALFCLARSDSRKSSSAMTDRR